jgi:GTPase SAR1 family protein
LKDLKILILGTAESGKSSIFKQIQKLHDENFYTEKVCIGYSEIIFENLVHATSEISKECFKIKQPFEDPDNIGRAEAIIKLDEDYGRSILFTKEIHSMLTEPWKEKSLKEILQENGHQLHIFDNFQYFLEKLDTLTPPNYVPSVEEILHCRKKTIGMDFCEFKKDKVKFTLIDRGGQAVDRKKQLKSKNF